MSATMPDGLTPICREPWMLFRSDYELGAVSRAEYEALELMLVRMSQPHDDAHADAGVTTTDTNEAT